MDRPREKRGDPFLRRQPLPVPGIDPFGLPWAFNLKKNSSWLSNGIWNTAEHASTRILDAVATLVLLWSVPTEKFSHLAIAQAWVAPALLLFIAPETILYRDFAKWQIEGKGVLLTRIRALRRFAWGKVLAGVVLSLGIAAVSGSDDLFFDRFFALIWAFSLPLAPQIAGPDRELLRIALHLRELNFVTFFQRALYLGLLLFAIRFFDSSMASLAVAASTAVLLSATFSRFLVERSFRGTRAVKSPTDSFRNVISNSLIGFSLWNHIAGIVIGWMQTMDLFFLGIFRFSAIEIGLYSTVLKLSNFALAAPFAFSNLYAVRLGRVPPEEVDSNRIPEKRKMWKVSGVLVLFSMVQALLFRLLFPALLTGLSRGRWSEVQIVRMLGWLNWILPACALFGSLLLWTAWLNVRTSIRLLVLRAYVPWGIFALGSYAWCTSRYGPEGAARANLLVVALLVPLLVYATRSAERDPRILK